MPRMTLVGAAILAVLVGCRDGPTTLELPVEPQTPVEIKASAQPDVLLAIQQMMDDPLVLEIVEALGDQTVAEGLDDIRVELDRQAVRGDKLAVHTSLMSALDLVAGDPAGADLVLRDVLWLVLDDAGTMLVNDVDVAPAEVVEHEGVKHGEPVKH